MCHFICCYWIGPQCFWWQTGSPLLVRSSQYHFLYMLWMLLKLWGWRLFKEREKGGYCPTIDSVCMKAPEHTHLKQSIQAVQLSFFQPFFFLSCAVGDDRSHHHFLFLHRFLYPLFSLIFSPFFSHTCTHVYKFTYADHSPFSSAHIMDLQRAIWASLTV